MYDIGWQHGLCAINQEERSVACGSVRSCTNTPENSWQFIYPSSSGAMQRYFESWFDSLKDYAIGAFDLSVRLRMSYGCQVKPNSYLLTLLCQFANNKICPVVC